MIEKIRLIEERIAQLEDILNRSRAGKSYADYKWTESLLHLNKKILTQLKLGLPIEFYKVQYTDETAKGFFLTKAELYDQFLKWKN